MRPRLVLSLFLLASLLGSAVAQETIRAANPDVSPINQRRGFGNGCGPASLLNAFQAGNEKWQRVFNDVPGKDSRTRLRHVINTWGRKKSSHTGKLRWQHLEGVNLLDLTDMGNEMKSRYFLPKLRFEVLTSNKNESRPSQLKRIHSRFSRCFKKGLPPIISIRRYAFRNHPQVGQKTWWPIRAHFVVITEIPHKLPAQATSFKVKYIDPFGGFHREGHIRCDTLTFKDSPFLRVDFPTASVGKKFIRKNEANVVTLNAVLGSW